MTLLQVMPEHDGGQVELRTTDPDVIAEQLRPHGISLTRLPVVELPPDAAPDDVLAAYRSEVDRIVADGGFRLVDVIRLQATDDPERQVTAQAARERFRDEHRHDEDEVRFFVAGHGCFYLHLDRSVYAVLCEAGDLMSVPAGTRHWYDMGERPDFCAIRFFQADDGWVADFTGDPIARRMPDLPHLLSVPR